MSVFEQVHSEHCAITQALKAGDAQEAESLMQHHLDAHLLFPGGKTSK